MTTTISIPTPLSTTATWTLTVVSDCTITTLTDKTISDIVYGVTLTKSDTDIFFQDSISTGKTNDAYCGARKYTLTPNTYGWLSITGDTMSVETSALGDVGNYPNIQLKIELNDYPMVTPITKTFQVTITCTVTTLTFTTSPAASTDVVVGVTLQPVDLNWAISKTPNCVQDPTYTLAVDDQSWLTNNVNADGESGYLRTNGATLANLGQFVRTLTAVVDAQTQVVSFTINIKDPCQASTFVDGATPADMTITMPSAGPTSQTQYILTDVQTNYSLIICPYTGVLTPVPSTPSKSWISWVPTGPNTIVVDHSLITTPADYGTHAFKFTVDS